MATKLFNELPDEIKDKANDSIIKALQNGTIRFNEKGELLASVFDSIESTEPKGNYNLLIEEQVGSKHREYPNLSDYTMQTSLLTSLLRIVEGLDKPKESKAGIVSILSGLIEESLTEEVSMKSIEPVVKAVGSIVESRF